MLDGLGLDHECVDGANDASARLRNNLFLVSGKYAVYPQLFVLHANGSMRFIGGYERVKELNGVGFLKKDIQQGFADAGLNEEERQEESKRQAEAARAIQKVRRGSLVRADGGDAVRKRLGKKAVGRRDSTLTAANAGFGWGAGAAAAGNKGEVPSSSAGTAGRIGGRGGAGAGGGGGGGSGPTSGSLA